jgi:hypothetical protein
MSKVLDDEMERTAVNLEFIKELNRWRWCGFLVVKGYKQQSKAFTGTLKKNRIILLVNRK